MAQVLDRLRTARRPVVMAGLGAVSAAGDLRWLIETLGCPVFTTLSARGVVPEDHPLCLATDLGTDAVHVLNEAVETADLVVALGCKFSHNGTGGGRLRLPADRLIHIDASSGVLDGDYPASLALEADVPALLGALRRTEGLGPGGWSREELEALRNRLRAIGAGPEPVLRGTSARTPGAFFESLRQVLPRDTILVTDSGWHQALARRYWKVLAPRGLLAPSDFQSMGFGIPAGIGAALAAPGRRVVVLTGDGGFAMAGMELLTAVREQLALTVIVFNDGAYGLIRQQMVNDYGAGHGVELLNPDFAVTAEALGVEYACVEADLAGALGDQGAGSGVRLVEVPVGESTGQRVAQARARARSAARTMLPGGLLQWLKRRS